MVLMLNITVWAIIGIAVCAITFIPMVIYLFLKAKRGYDRTWITQEFDFTAYGGRLYLNDKKLHVNYSKEYNEIYVHNMGDFKNKYKATFYGTIEAPYTNIFLRYLQENCVPLEIEEPYMGISRYRRSL